MTLRTSWPPVLPQDRAALVAQETALVAAGIHPVLRALEVLDDPDPARLRDAALAEARARATQGGA